MYNHQQINTSPKQLIKLIKAKIAKPKMNVTIRTADKKYRMSNSLPGSAYGYLIQAIADSMQGVTDQNLSSTFYTLATTTGDIQIPLVGAYFLGTSLYFEWADLSNNEYTPTALLIGLPVSYVLSSGSSASGYIYPFATIQFYNFTKTANNYFVIEWYITINLGVLQPYAKMFLPNGNVNGIVRYTNETSGVNYGAIQISYSGSLIELSGTLSATESCGTTSVDANVQLQSDIVSDIASGTVVLTCQSCTSSQTSTTCSGSYVVDVSFYF
jgi:hypothetical protein